MTAPQTTPDSTQKEQHISFSSSAGGGRNVLHRSVTCSAAAVPFANQIGRASAPS